MIKHLCLCVLLCSGVSHANSLSVEPISLPDPESIVAFTNGLPVSAGTREMKKKEDILRFLKDGVNLRKVRSDDDQVLLAQRTALADGVFTDKAGKFYFWTFISPTRLWLQTPEGGAAIAELPGG